MPDYAHCKIYELWHVGSPDVKVVDATTQKLLCSRMTGYRAEYKRAPMSPFFRRLISVVPEGQLPQKGLRIRLLELYKCGSRAELQWRVEFWRKKMAPAAPTDEGTLLTPDGAIDDMKSYVAALSY